MQVGPSIAVTRRRIRRTIHRSVWLGLITALVTTAHLSRDKAALVKRDTEPGDVACGFQGDDNTYGIGLRLGLYLQWATTSLANNFVPEEAVTMRGVNNCFQLSTFAGILYITFTRGATQNAGQLYAVEVWIALMLCLGGVCGGQGASNEPNEETHTTFAGHQSSTIGGIIQLLLYCGIVFYGMWFIYTGMDQMAYLPCSTSAFFFARVNLFHWYRTFLKVTFTFLAVGCGIGLILLVYTVVSALITNGFWKTAAWITDFNEDWKHRDDDDKVFLSLTNTYFGFGLAFFILSVELTIRWNHIQGVQDIQSTGQILPLAVGGAGLIRVLYKFLIKAMRGDYSINPNYSCGILCCTFSQSHTSTYSYSSW